MTIHGPVGTKMLGISIFARIHERHHSRWRFWHTIASSHAGYEQAAHASLRQTHDLLPIVGFDDGWNS